MKLVLAARNIHPYFTSVRPNFWLAQNRSGNLTVPVKIVLPPFECPLATTGMTQAHFKDAAISRVPNSKG